MTSHLRPASITRTTNGLGIKLLGRYLKFWWSTCNWKVVLAAVPDGLLIAAYVAAYYEGTELFGLSARWLSELMQIEFLVIHSFLFLGLIALPKADTKKEKITQWSAFFVFLSGYLLFASSAGWAGIGAFLGATAATYFGFLLNYRSPRRYSELGLRWLMSFLAFMITSGIADMPEDVGKWDGRISALFFGVLYFSTLAVLELIGLYRAPWLAPAKRRKRA